MGPLSFFVRNPKLDKPEITKYNKQISPQESVGQIKLSTGP